MPTPPVRRRAPGSIVQQVAPVAAPATAPVAPAATPALTTAKKPLVLDFTKKKPVPPEEKVAPPPKTDSEKALAAVHKRFGDQSAYKATDIPSYCLVDSGIFALDYATLGGFIEGTLNMIYGWEGSGKTTTGIRLCSHYLRKYAHLPEMRAVFLDREGTMDRLWAEKLGVDLDRLIYLDPDAGESGVDMIDVFMSCADVGFMVIDSVPAMTPGIIAENSAEDDTMGKLGQLMSKLYSKILVAQARRRRDKKPRLTIILINQFRASMKMMGDPRSLPGGNAIRYGSTGLVEIKKKEIVGESSAETSALEIVSHAEHSFKIKRWKTGNVMQEGQFEVVLDPDNPMGEGAVDDLATVCMLAKKLGYITGAGSSWRIQGINGGDPGDPVKESFKSQEGAFNYLAEHEDDLLYLKRSIIMCERVKRKMPEAPPDNYLLGWMPKEDA